MSPRNPARTQSAAKRRKAVPIPSPDPDQSTIDALDLPEDLRALFYIESDLICIDYTLLERYFTSLESALPRADSKRPPKKRTSVCIDISSHTPVKPALPSFNILPYIWLYITFTHIRFKLLTENDAQGQALGHLATNVLHKHSHNWRTLVLESGNVAEVRIWWQLRTIDIVLRRGGDWANTWDCHAKDSQEVAALKDSLGLVVSKAQWRGAVVVASVEADDT